MNTKKLLKNVSKYETLPLALWVLKDALWVMNFHWVSMFMIVPTLAIAAYVAWMSQKSNTALFRNVAICYWLAANGVWMTGEFFNTYALQPYAMVLFTGGLVVIASYYVFHYPSKKLKVISQAPMGVSRTMMEPVKKVA